MSTPKADKDILLMMQFGQTLRYHTQLMLRNQDVAQHSYNVVMLLIYLCPLPVPASLMLAGLLHDAGERWTGDMPADVKLRLRMGAALDNAEQEALAAAGVTMPELTQNEKFLLKTCDALEGLMHCTRDALLGNRLPEHKYMLENYVCYAINSAAMLPPESVERQRASELISQQEKICERLFR